MSLETKPIEAEAPAQESPAPAKKGGQVLGYIMILFIAAFLLMALSFLMHQRSNTEAMGELQTSFTSTIDDLQAMQERILSLEKELSDAKETLSDAQSRLADAETALQSTQSTLEAEQLRQEAMTQLYCLQQKYADKQYEACQALIQSMEESGLVDALPSTPLDTEHGVVTAPFVRFNQFKAAVQKAVG
ncbi:MAG: hypothetical protein E7443_01795 [Ruminococcaceae bacterium]|nr:hypothetical protein [Oscillospiraceae bacterium]